MGGYSLEKQGVLGATSLTAIPFRPLFKGSHTAPAVSLSDAVGIFLCIVWSNYLKGLTSVRIFAFPFSQAVAPPNQPRPLSQVVPKLPPGLAQKRPGPFVRLRAIPGGGIQPAAGWGTSPAFSQPPASPPCPSQVYGNANSEVPGRPPPPAFAFLLFFGPPGPPRDR